MTYQKEIITKRRLRRAIRYNEAGNLVVRVEGYAAPLEIFLNAECPRCAAGLEPHPTQRCSYFADQTMLDLVKNGYARWVEQEKP